MNDPDPEITGLFLQESAEHLERLERALLDLEDHPDEPELIASVFRSVHTIKGTSGFLGFSRLEALAHAGEEVLSRMRDGRLRLSADVMAAMLALIDDLRATLGNVERTGAEGALDHSGTIGRLRALLPDGDSAGRDHIPATDAAGSAAPAAPVTLAELKPSPARDGAVAEVPADDPTSGPSLAVASDTSVRLAVNILDRIMDLTGELVVLRSRLGAVIGDDEATPVTTIHRDLRQVTSGLQAEVMRSRLQPVEVVIGRLRRIARDLAHSLGKQIHVEISGEEVAVDRAINDALRDPLLHLVRNAVDHGVEPPEERVAAGKDRIGRLTVTASHARGRVRIDVRDDGRGLDLAALRRRAVAAGLVSPDEAEGLSDRAAAELALQPGISTSTEVTKLSGRGVGLDVVRNVLGTIGGRVDITSAPGAGTCFTVNVPLTLAMLPVLTVTCAGDTYCIPQANVLEVRDLAADESALTAVDHVPIYRLRGQLLPLVGLAGVLRPQSGAGVLAGATRVVIVEGDERRFALAVPSAGDTFDVVVKPMTPETRGIPMFIGVSVLADGHPALILDVAGLADEAGVTPRPQAPTASEPPSAPRGESAIVLAEIDGGGSVAVRLTDVVRLERFAAADLKRRGEAVAVMYGDEIMPLLRVADVLPERRRTRRNGGDGVPQSDSVPAIVCRVQGRLVGLVVGQILDIVPEPPTPTQSASRPGVIASIYVRDQFAELLDLPMLAAQAEIGPP